MVSPNERFRLCLFVLPFILRHRRYGVGRKLSFGSDSEEGARMTAIMYTVLGTILMNGPDVLRWLRAWLDACAENGARPPEDLASWLPWSMSEDRKRHLLPP